MLLNTRIKIVLVLTFITSNHGSIQETRTDDTKIQAITLKGDSSHSATIGRHKKVLR